MLPWSHNDCSAAVVAVVFATVVFISSIAMCQLAGVDLVQSGAAGDIPVTVVAWGAPKIGNSALAACVDALHPKLRILRVKNPIDKVANRESCSWPGLENVVGWSLCLTDCNVQGVSYYMKLVILFCFICSVSRPFFSVCSAFLFFFFRFPPSSSSKAV